MLKHFLSLTLMFVSPFLCHSQANVYSSAAEKSQSDMSISHVVGNVVSLESEDGSLSTGALVQYSVAVVTGMDVEEISLLTVYPNPTKDVLVLRTGGLKGLTMTLTDAEGKLLQTAQVRDEETSVDFSRYAAGLYQLTLTRGKGVVKTFSVIKN